MAAEAEHVHRRQVAVKENGRRRVLGEPHRPLTSVLVQVRWDQLDELRLALLILPPGVVEVGDVFRDRAIGRIRHPLRWRDVISAARRSSLG